MLYFLKYTLIKGYTTCPRSTPHTAATSELQSAYATPIFICNFTYIFESRMGSLVNVFILLRSTARWDPLKYNLIQFYM